MADSADNSKDAHGRKDGEAQLSHGGGQQDLWSRYPDLLGAKPGDSDARLFDLIAALDAHYRGPVPPIDRQSALALPWAPVSLDASEGAAVSPSGSLIQGSEPSAATPQPRPRGVVEAGNRVELGERPSETAMRSANSRFSRVFGAFGRVGTIAVGIVLLGALLIALLVVLQPRRGPDASQPSTPGAGTQLPPADATGTVAAIHSLASTPRPDSPSDIFGQPTPVADLCAILTKADVERATGTTVTQGTTNANMQRSLGANCIYTLSGGESVWLEVGTAANEASAADLLDIQLAPTYPYFVALVPGLGDAAVLARLPAPGASSKDTGKTRRWQLTVKRGRTYVALTWVTARADATAGIEQMARVVMPRIDAGALKTPIP